MGPNYKRPQVALPEQFRGAPAGGGAASLADTKWQELFPDPTLNQIVTTALEHNFDLRIAAERSRKRARSSGSRARTSFRFWTCRLG